MGLKDLKSKIRLRQEAEPFEIGYNNSMKPLGQRDDLDVFLLMAYDSGRKDYLGYFVNPPSHQELLDAIADDKLADLRAKGLQPKTEEEKAKSKTAAVAAIPVVLPPLSEEKPASQKASVPTPIPPIPATDGPAAPADEKSNSTKKS